MTLTQFRLYRVWIGGTWHRIRSNGLWYHSTSGCLPHRETDATEHHFSEHDGLRVAVYVLLLLGVVVCAVGAFT